jgi:protein-S-isoprenylcysteine O-methyltransferase Ste14
MTAKKLLITKLLMIFSPVVGGLSLFLFVFFLFKGSLDLIVFDMPGSAVLVWDGLLSVLFFIQHSGMIRRGFKARLLNYFPSYYSDAFYALVSGLTLTAVVILWQPSATVLLELDGLARWLARSVFILGVMGTAWGAMALGVFDPFGRSAIKDHFNGKPRDLKKLSIDGPYLWVRHPLYFFTLLLIWSCPELTLDRLLFNLLWTAWIVIGTVLEEKDLVSDFGDDYRRYQKRVPMLIPWKGRRNKPV